MIKASSINTSNVTDLQIGMCHKIFVGHVAWYKVQSESDPLKEYTVTHTKEKGFTCTCPAGNVGFSKCKDGICKHVKWSVAASREERAAIKEMELAIAVEKAMSDPETVKSAELAREAPEKVSRKRETAPIERKAFSILR
jgi:hypothetical protein